MNRNKGFTLIEVLAALIIIGLGMLAVIRAVNQTVSNTSYLRDKAFAHWVAMNKLTETRLSLTLPSTGDTDGDVDMAGVTWHWRMSITAIDQGIERIDVKVAPKNQGADASMDTVFGIYGSSFAPSTSSPGWDFSNSVPGSSTSSSASSASSSASSNAKPGPLN